MSQHRQSTSVVEDISEQLEIQDDGQGVADDYKSLNEKCDVVISKIKKRKNKSRPPSNE